MLDRAQGTPLHHQVFLIVRDAILSGRYRPGDLLPTAEAFVAQFGVSRITLRELALAGKIPGVTKSSW